MLHPRRISVGIVLAIALITVGAAATAWAHEPAPVLDSGGPIASVAVTNAAPALPAPDLAPSIPAVVPLALTIALLLGVAAGASRRLRIAMLALVFVVFAVETSVHSVHHLTDRHAASQCAVASASTHVLGTEESLGPDDVCLAVSLGTAAAAEPERLGRRPLRPDEGRAPPAA